MKRENRGISEGDTEFINRANKSIRQETKLEY